MTAPVPFVLTPDERRAAERESKLLEKVVNLSGRLGAIKKLCELALEDCCHKGSNQARRLQAAIEKAGEP